MTNISWNSLTRQEQKLMARLYGGGSTRNQALPVISGLRELGLIDEDSLSPSGNDLCKLLELTMMSRRSITGSQLAGEPAQRQDQVQPVSLLVSTVAGKTRETTESQLVGN